MSNQIGLLIAEACTSDSANFDSRGLYGPFFVSSVLINRATYLATAKHFEYQNPDVCLPGIICESSDRAYDAVVQAQLTGHPDARKPYIYIGFDIYLLDSIIFKCFAEKILGIDPDEIPQIIGDQGFHLQQALTQEQYIYLEEERISIEKCYGTLRRGGPSLILPPTTLTASA